MPSLKEDASFIEFLSMGAAATERTINFLNSNGHEIIELERGALSSRLWENKEKRLRVPDLLCLNCGRRIESRGKKNLEITMSHSTSDEERAWDYDVEDDDWVAIVRCSKTGERPRDCAAADVVNIVSIEKLRATEDMTKQERGGPTQGSELTITWPSSTASADGFVKAITDTDRLQVTRESDGYTLSYSLEKKIDDDEYVMLTPLVEPGERVQGESQFIAAPFDLVSGDELACSQDYSESDFVSDLSSDSFTDRFTAIKALGHRTDEEGLDILKEMLNDPERHPFARLEAAASLAKQEEDEGWAYLSDALATVTEDEANKRLEVAILLSEIDDENAVRLLQEILNNDTEIDEIRAEAAHSLGTLGATAALSDLIRGFEANSRLIRRDCVDAASKIIAGDEEDLLRELNSSQRDRKLGCALAVAEAGPDVLERVVENANELPKDSIAIALGLTDPTELAAFLHDGRFSEEITFAAATMSDFFNSWADTLTDDLRYELRQRAEQDEEEQQSQQATLN